MISAQPIRWLSRPEVGVKQRAVRGEDDERLDMFVSFEGPSTRLPVQTGRALCRIRRCGTVPSKRHGIFCIDG